MISKTFYLIRENALFFLGIIAVFVLLSMVEQAGYFKSSQSVATSIIWLLVTWLVQRAILFNVRMHERLPDGGQEKIGPYLGKGFALIFLGIVLSIPFIVAAVDGFSTGAGLTGTSFLIMGAGSVLCIGAMFALLGTWLPATIVGREAGFGAALRRGTKTFLPVFGRMLGMNVAAFALIIALVAGFGNLPAGTAMSIVLDAVITLIGAINVTYVAIVLAETYQRYEAAREQAASATS